MKMKLGIAALLSVGALAVAAGCGDSGSGGAGGTSTSATGSTTSSSSSKASSGTGTSTGTGTATSSSTGGGAPTCAQYCTAVMMNCTGANADFASNDECMTACGTIPSAGMATDTTGNTIGCHLYHASAAGSTGMPDVHCPHADVPSTDNGNPGPCS